MKMPATNAATAGLKEFELTWVVYDSADPLGAIMALFTLSPVCVASSLCDSSGGGSHLSLGLTTLG